MRKFTQNLLLLTAASLFIFSCGEDEEPTFAAPSVSVSATVDGSPVASGADVAAGSEIVISATVTAPGGVNGLTQGTQSYSRTELGADPGDTQGSITFQPQLLGADLAGQTVSWEFQGVDDAGQLSETVTFSVNVLSPAVNAYTAVLLGAQGNAEPGFFNALDGTRLSYAEARDASGVDGSTVDFAYYFGTMNENTIASIDDAGLNAVYDAVSLPIDGIFGTRNSTTFLSSTLSATDFEGVNNNAALATAAEFEVAGSSSITELQVDQVIAFKFDDDRGAGFGLIRVASIDDTNGNGTITIEVKVAGE